MLGPNSVALLDLLRALAANLVLFEHAADILGIPNRVPTGLIGVSIFFILSGFLILQSSLSRIGRPGPYFMPYMIDRFARVFTAYIPVLALVAAVNSMIDLGLWGQSGASTGLVAFLGNLLLLQNYPAFQALHRFVTDAFYIRPYNTAEPFWTIPIEFWIYVVFGLYLFGLVMRERIGLLLSIILALVAVPVVIWNAAAGGGNGLSLVWLAGAVAAYVWAGPWHRSPHKLQIGATVLVTALTCLLGRGFKIDWNFQDLGMALCVTLAVLGGISVTDGMRPLPQMLRSACTLVASYSYSLYLVHNTVLVVARHLLPNLPRTTVFLAALAASHVVAFLVYVLFERHYRHVGAWLKQKAGLRKGTELATDKAVRL